MKASFDSRSVKDAAKSYVWPIFGKDPSFFDETASIAVSAEGPYVTDIDGNRFIDAWACATAATLGYNHPRIVEAMTRQMSAMVQNAGSWPANLPQVQLAEKIASLTPGSLQYSIFACNGTDANETAIKIAREYHKLRGHGAKYKVIGRDRNYHGMSLSTLAAGGSIRRRKYMDPFPTGFTHISTPNAYRPKYSGDEAEVTRRYADELRRTIEFEDPETVACFIGEQTLGGGGILPPPPGYMKQLRQICDDYDVLLIVDEVITGFGRTGTWFECEQYDFVPDMITMAKGITSGHAPLSATHVKPEIAETFFGHPDRLFHHGYTYSGMAVSCAAGVATIEYIEESGLLGTLAGRSDAIRRELDGLKERSPVLGDVRSNGMLFAVELVSDKQTKECWTGPVRENVAKAIVDTGKRHGVIFPVLNNHGGLYIIIAPPLNIRDTEMEAIFTSLEAALQEAERIGNAS
jgi:taurine-pyruvate aminotransferase